jgi:predicted DNA-binding transcriptional regulator AlpA
MHVTWQDIDRWRAEKKMTNSDVARKTGISESAIYRGLNRNSKLQSSTRRVMHTVFPDKIDAGGEVVS